MEFEINMLKRIKIREICYKHDITGIGRCAWHVALDHKENCLF